MAADNNDGKKIQLNRKMRMWNKYKNIVIGVVSVIVIVAIVAAVLKIGSIGRNDNSGQTATADKNNSTMMAEAGCTGRHRAEEYRPDYYTGYNSSIDWKCS